MPVSNHPESNSELMAAARGGSSEAIGILMQSCRTYLLVVGQRELSADLRVKISPSDLVQETFAEGQRVIGSFAGNSPGEFQAWLRAILLHKLANARRRYLMAESRDLAREERPNGHSSVIAQAELFARDDTPSTHAIRQEEARHVQAALARMPSHYRQVVQLRNYDLLPFAEIAQVMQGSEHALRALWVRAMQRLKRELDGLDDC